MKTKVIALTGGIGSGKSVVAHILQVMDIPVYNCDEEAKRLNETDDLIRKSLIKIVGDKVYREDGTLDKAVLIAYLFDSPFNAARIHAVIHPRVRAHFEHWMKSHDTLPLVGIESAILFEAGFADLAEQIWLVIAPVDLRKKRAMRRDNTTQDAVERRMANQLDDEEKKKRATRSEERRVGEEC